MGNNNSSDREPTEPEYKEAVEKSKQENRGRVEALHKSVEDFANNTFKTMCENKEELNDWAKSTQLNGSAACLIAASSGFTNPYANTLCTLGTSVGALGSLGVDYLKDNCDKNQRPTLLPPGSKQP